MIPLRASAGLRPEFARQLRERLLAQAQAQIGAKIASRLDIEPLADTTDGEPSTPGAATADGCSCDGAGCC